MLTITRAISPLVYYHKLLNNLVFTMGIPSKPCYDSFSQIPPKQHKEKLWDPIATLDIINPDRGRLTCVGHAVTCGRRCRNPINQANQFSAFQLLQELSYIDTSTTDINAKLHCLAKLTLCVRYHYNQADDMAKKWSKEINQLQEASRNRTDIKIEPESLEEVLINLQKLLDRLNKNMTADAIPFSSPASQYYQEQFGRNSAQEEEAAKRRKEEMCKSQEQERQQQEREKREQEGKEQKQREEEERRKKEQQARDREAREREERKERIRQEAEQLRKEQERKEKERKKREAEEEKRQEEQRARDKEVREREERNERCRRRAEKAKEDRERKERELKAKAREEWDKAWLDYVLRWDDLKSELGFRLR
jgi:hypothetical protein